MYELKVDQISKRFGPRKVFARIDFELATGDSLAITGDNGSGKSTLISVLLSLLRPTKGTITYSKDGTALDDDQVRKQVSLVAPYLNLYDQLTAEENLQFFATVAGGHITGKEIDALLHRVGLEGRGSDFAGEYSSGMKQRLKYAMALLNNPSYLFLDEPTSNLDDAGKQMVFELIDELRSDTILLIATNEKEEYSLATKECRLG